MQNVKNTILDDLLSIVAPHLCSGCQKPGTLLCSSCEYDIINEPFGRCILCLRPAASGICREHPSPIERAWCVGERRDSLQRLIGSYKFQNAKAAYRYLGALLDHTLPDLPTGAVLVPIPTLSSHIRERGYDHIALVAQYLASRRQLSIDPVLSRTSKTTQRHSTRQERIKHASRAFRVEGTLSPDTTYIIVDDVVTTGATIKQATRLLRSAGARHIWVAVIARQPLD